MLSYSIAAQPGPDFPLGPGLEHKILRGALKRGGGNFFFLKRNIQKIKILHKKNYCCEIALIQLRSKKDDKSRASMIGALGLTSLTSVGARSRDV